MSFHPARLHLLRSLPLRIRAGVDPAIRWVRRELDAARRDNMDAQFMATARGSAYGSLDRPGW